MGLDPLGHQPRRKSPRLALSIQTSNLPHSCSIHGCAMPNCPTCPASSSVCARSTSA
jgi:hypothetical protein